MLARVKERRASLARGGGAQLRIELGPREVERKTCTLVVVKKAGDVQDKLMGIPMRWEGDGGLCAVLKKHGQTFPSEKHREWTPEEREAAMKKLQEERELAQKALEAEGKDGGEATLAKWKGTGRVGLGAGKMMGRGGHIFTNL